MLADNVSLSLAFKVNVTCLVRDNGPSMTEYSLALNSWIEGTTSSILLIVTVICSEAIFPALSVAVAVNVSADVWW